MEIKLSENYRRDIDGLRAIAVLAVILFHFGYLPNGYLGVDVFFVISGYLITKIVFKEVVENRFSIIEFYLRRIRRIIPLVLFTTTIALITGLFVMLPDDLENLSQSVIATNFFANNILLLITTRDYWNIVNEYKPLMHTWSLGIEEQFYLFYPLIFLMFRKRTQWILPLLLALTAISIFLFISSSNDATRFYLIQFRFFELSLGGLGSIVLKDKAVNSRYKVVLISVLLFILLVNVSIPNSLKLILIVIASLSVLISANTHNSIGSFILENKLMVGIGKISFSLYMWHQIVLAFTRYFILDEFSITASALIFIVILLLSIFSYYIIEQPFRNKKRIKTGFLLVITFSVFLLSTGFSLYIYSISGIIKDVPELELVKANVQKNTNIINVQRNAHIEYNARIYDLNKNFTANNKIKVLIIGDSFARDWANILLESKYRNKIEISYVFDINNSANLKERLSIAKYVFFSEMDKVQLDAIAQKFNLDASKVWNVGTKNFGSNNGIFYNRRSSPYYCSQRTKMLKGVLERNYFLKKQWGNKYIDLIEMVVDKAGTIPVFTPNCKFISQDCKHLTHSGAVLFAQLLNTNQHFKIE